MRRKAKLSWIAVGCTVAAVWLLFAVPAYAVEEHLYDPVLSLTGDTSISQEDEVPDPGSVHPPKAFNSACGVVTDRHGDIYVASAANSSTAGRIDVFDPHGNFLTEILDEREPCGLAVDSKGNLYVQDYRNYGPVYMYHPVSYPPQSGTGYGEAVIYDPSQHGNPGAEGCLTVQAVAVDPSDDHLYLVHQCRVEEYGSADNGSPLIDEKAIGGNSGSFGIPGYYFYAGDVYGANQDVYITAQGPLVNDKVFVFDRTDGHAKCAIDGSETPAGGFDFELRGSLAVDQANGDFYVWDEGHHVVAQYATEAGGCKFVGLLPEPPKLKTLTPFNDIAVDDPLNAGEVDYDSPNAGYVYVTSGNFLSNHLFAFKPKVISTPEIRNQAAIEIGETEAVLRAELNPNGLPTAYHFEYTTQAEYEQTGYASAAHIPVPDSSTVASGTYMGVSEPITGLEAGVAYRFRLVASNCGAAGAVEGACLTIGEGKPGEEGEDASFSTYPKTPAVLPDGRAYELVTPPDTAGHVPTMTFLGRNFGGNGFLTLLASPDGESVIFGSNSGSFPSVGGGGYQDTFEARRDPVSGWRSQFNGFSAAQAEKPRPGGVSADHGYGFWYLEGNRGALSVDNYQYLHVPAGIEASPNCGLEGEPAGRFERVGCGSLGFDPYAQGLWISPGGAHVIFMSGKSGGAGSLPVQLEPCAPPSTPAKPRRALYDRSPGGQTHCVGIPPAGASAPIQAEFETATPDFKAASTDGSAVAFSVGSTTYVRVGGEETVELDAGGLLFSGFSADGSRAFYLKDPAPGAVSRGEIFVCEVELGPCAGPGSHAPIQIGSGGESALVNVSADGSHVYFVSKKALTGGEENEAGEEAEAGKENFFAWDGSTIRFIALLDPLDVSGEPSADGAATVGGLGLWVGPGKPIIGSALDPSRSSPDGTTLAFESRASLTGYDSGGNSEVYRYDADAPSGARLSCLSCNPTGAPAVSSAQLQSDPSGFPETKTLPPVDEMTRIPNVTADGEKVFFQSGDRLVPADLDGKVDVYEWQAQGTDGCEREGGCLALISGARSSGDDYLYAAGADGRDVFFLSGDTLVPQDRDRTPSIYDARVGGGFPESPGPSAECLGEACQPTVLAPDDPTPASLGFEGVVVHKHHKHRHKKHHRHHKHKRGHRNQGGTR